MKLSPAQYVIQTFGGVRDTARILGVLPTSVSRWKLRRPKRGDRGLIPSHLHRKILKKASKLNLDITPFDLVWGREITKH